MAPPLTFFQNVFSALSLTQGDLIPERTALEAARIAADPSRALVPHGASLAAPLVVGTDQFIENLFPRLSSFAGRLGITTLDRDALMWRAMESLGAEKDGTARADAATAPEELFPSDRFDGLNVRTLEGYDVGFFGVDPLVLNGFLVKDEERILGKMVTALPRGAVVADWGGGIGLFAADVKRLRPDLEVFVNDLHPPEELLERSRTTPSASFERWRRRVRYLTGDATRVALPPESKAHLLTSCWLSLYLPDPLRFIAHAHDQLRPGGTFVTTLPQYVFESRPKAVGQRSFYEAFFGNLRRLGLDFRTMKEGRTLALRRRDERRLRISAVLDRSALTNFQIRIGPRIWNLQQYMSFYGPGPGGPDDWAVLEG